MRNCESIDLLAKKTPKKLFENTRKVHSVPSAKEVKGSWEILWVPTGKLLIILSNSVFPKLLA